MQSTKKSMWVLGPGGNYILEGNKFFISYANVQGLSFFDSDNFEGETAIVKDGKYFILNGDHRDEYKKLIKKGFNACVKYFKTYPELRSSWSN